MSLQRRRILYLSFILLFFILTPSLILYALGYNLESGFKLQKSGILIIESEPEGAVVSIEDKNIKRIWGALLGADSKVRTPAKIKGIKPGEYNFSLDLEGYWPWSKKLTIHPGQTTFAEDIYLFKNDEAIKISDVSKLSGSFSGNNKFYLDANTNSYKVISLDEQKIILSHEFSSSTEIQEADIQWSANDRYALREDYLFSVSNSDKAINLRELLGDNYSKAKWDDLDRDSILYYLDNKLYSYNFSNIKSSEISRLENLDDYLSKGDNIFYIQEDKSISRLQVLNRNTGNSSVVLDLPLSNYKFINTDHALLNIYDEQHNILYLVEPFSSIRPLIEIFYNARSTHWIDQNRLLYTTGFELWLSDINTLEKRLYTRLSEKINNIAWHPSNNYLIFSTDQSINILELDSREKYSITKILEIPGIDKMVLDKKGEKLYFTAKQEEVNTLYTLFIQ